jgi:hypothetical protein
MLLSGGFSRHDGGSKSGDFGRPGGMDVQMAKQKAKSSVSRAVATPYSSKIIKAGALISDTKTLLAHWHPSEIVAENTARLRRENVFGKSSRSRVEDIVAIFRQRYMGEPSVTSALACLAQSRLPSAVLDRLLYFHSARADSLLFDSVVEILQPMHDKGIVTVELPEVHAQLSKWVEQGKTTGHWSSATITRIAQGLLATLRDFGVLEGAVKKRITPPFLPDEATAYIAFYLNQHQPSGAKLVEQRDWQLFFLTPEVVERLLFEAHQKDLLEYHVAGTVTRLTFPARTLEEYADVIAQRAH